MKVKSIAYFSIFVFTLFSLISCTSKSNNEENIQTSISQENSFNNNEEIINIIESYFKFMEENNIEAMENLFASKLKDLPQDGFNFDYIKKVEVNKIIEANENIDVYIDYINGDYGIPKEDIKIFEVSFNIHTNDNVSKESSQKIALVKENNKWLIFEMFR